MNKLFPLLLLLFLYLCPPLPAEEQDDEEEELMEFNIGFYYDEEAAKNVKRLGGMVMHANICASQFNQALITAGIDNVWVNAAMVGEIDYNARGDSTQALLHQLVKDTPEALKDIEEYKLDFIVVFVCMKKEDEGEKTLGVAVELFHRDGEFDAGDDHAAEWEEQLEDSNIEGAHFDVVETPIEGSEDKVRLSYIYRFIAMDLYHGLNSYTFIHELGHLFGAGHSRDQNQQRGPANPEITPYASGTYVKVREDGENHHYASVMAYNNAGYTDSGIEHVQLPMFSSTYPQHVGSHGEIILGSEEDDNARAIVENATMLAENRPYSADEESDEEEEMSDEEDMPDEDDEEEEDESTDLPTLSKWAPEHIL